MSESTDMDMGVDVGVHLVFVYIMLRYVVLCVGSSISWATILNFVSIFIYISFLV